MTVQAPRRRHQPPPVVAGFLGLALLAGGSAVAQPAEPAEAFEAGAGASVSASELQAAIDAIKRRVAAQQEGRESTGTSELTAELRSARQAIAELTQNLARLRSERDAVQAELTARSELEAELRVALAERLERESALEDALGLAERRADEARNALAGAREQASADHATHEAALAEARLQAEVSAERTVSLESALATAESELAELRTALAAAADDAAAGFAERDAALSASRAQVAAEAARAADLAAAVATIESDLEAVRGELARTVEQGAAALAASSEETARVAAQLAELEVAAATEAAALETAQATLAASRAELAEAAAERTAVEARLSAAAEVHTTLERRLEEAEAALATRDQEMIELRQVASRSVAEVEELGETLLGTLAENEALVAALAEARDSRTLIEGELRAMRRDLEAYAAAGDDPATAAPETVPLALVASDAAAEAIDAELAAARRQIAALNEELIARDKQLATAVAAGDTDALNQQLGLLQRQVETLSAENAKLLTDLAELQAQATPELIAASLSPDEAVEHYLGQLNAVDTGDGWWMTVPEGLVFAPGSDELAPGTEPAVAQIAALLGYFGEAQVRIVGHTDSFGDALVNKELSQQRADTVARTLVESFGIEARRIATEGLGEERPIASNDTIDGRRANRRVEVYIQR